MTPPRPPATAAELREALADRARLSRGDLDRIDDLMAAVRAEALDACMEACSVVRNNALTEEDTHEEMGRAFSASGARAKADGAAACELAIRALVSK